MEVHNLINVNIGILGHVDSGKTSLCKALSTTASTAAFDANPQSKERGITLDLGFSAFPMNDKWSVTLVDCPGHASLIRTVLGGVQIMDIMLLIIDITKGMQPQSAECLILANITCPNLIVVLNKVDMIEADARSSKVAKVMRLMNNVLSKTRFANQPIVVASVVDTDIGTKELKAAIVNKLENITLVRNRQSPFVLAVDHCFNIKGSGSICTGTVLQGGIKIGDTIEFPELQTTKKVKSMQMFRNPVTEAWAGDRVALGVPGLEAKRLERGVVAEPGLIKAGTRVVVIKIYKIPYYKEVIRSKSKFHVSIGYSTVTAKVMLFRNIDETDTFELGKNYQFVTEMKKDEVPGESIPPAQFAILEFDRPVYMLPNALVIGSNLQLVEETQCRLAFHGMVIDSSQDKDYEKTYLLQFKLFVWKSKQGHVDRVVSPDAIIAKGFCTKQSNIDHLVDKKVSIMINKEESKDNPTGRIQCRFGQTDKLRISVDSPLSSEQVDLIQKNSTRIILNYKGFIFKEGGDRKLVQ